ncbi:MAG: hypothetical protein AB7F99_07425, partial [Vicinamibacterales bacterium]
MGTNTTSAVESPRPIVRLGYVEDPQQMIYVVATTVRATSHALEVATTLARGRNQGVTVLVSAPERITITSARAHVYNLPLELPATAGQATPGAIRHPVARDLREADVQVTEAGDARGFAKVLPPDASVVHAGPIHHFVETQEQRLARKLTTLG